MVDLSRATALALEIAGLVSQLRDLVSPPEPEPGTEPEPEPEPETNPEPEPDPSPEAILTRLRDVSDAMEPKPEPVSTRPNRGHETEGGGTCVHCGANLGDWSGVDCTGAVE